MKELTCTTENKHQYKIMIGNGLKEHLYEMDEVFGSYRSIVIISDKNVAKLYLSNVRKQLRSLGAEVYTIVIPAGEESKIWLRSRKSIIN